ncbi:hypothetical protein GQ53DRAFT_180802 [Thozetella sp. PMI_491]|nr:hypothetical protein GQ53DRAFT_180802 [Thozetella sp. PMI_491]
MWQSWGCQFRVIGRPVYELGSRTSGLGGRVCLGRQSAYAARACGSQVLAWSASCLVIRHQGPSQVQLMRNTYGLRHSTLF